MGLPAPAYLSNSGRTVAEMKVAMEDQRDFIADMPGGAPRSTLTIAGGSITPPLGSGGGTFNVDTEALAAADDLTNCVLTNVPEGRYLRLYGANAGRVSTVKHAAGGSGQYLLRDSADFVLNATDKWIELQRVGTDLIEVDRGYGVDFPGLHDFLRISSVPAHNTLCPHQRLAVDYASASTVTVTADAVVLSDSLGRLKRFTGISATLNIANTGANGRDVVDNGGAEQASVWYHRWIIGKTDGTYAAFASQACYPGSATSIFTRLPVGYTWAGYIGAEYNDSGSNLLATKQRGDEQTRVTFTALSAGASATAASVSITAGVPITARIISGHAAVNNSAAPYIAVNGTVSADSGLNYSVSYVFAPYVSNGNAHGCNFQMLLVTPQTFWYTVAGGGTGRLSVYINGWRY